MRNFKVIIIPSKRELSVDIENSSQNNFTGEMGANWRNQRLSQNIIDLRKSYPGMRRVKLSGYLTWNTIFHWASLTASGIGNALVRKGFLVAEVTTRDRDRRNSQYYFEIWVWVWDRYSLADVQNDVSNALLTVAYGNSIRFSNVYYLS